MIQGKRRAVAGRYVVSGDRQVGFQIGEYDARHALVIDPVLSYATFLGGSVGDMASGVKLDGDGNI
jgi:hypothetical protein